MCKAICVSSFWDNTTLNIFTFLRFSIRYKTVDDAFEKQEATFTLEGPTVVSNDFETELYCYVKVCNLQCEQIKMYSKFLNALN